MEHPHKVLLLELAYPQRRASSSRIDVTQWGQQLPERIDLSHAPAVEVRPDFYDYRSLWNDSVEWHVNFADPWLFVAYGSGLLAQDEMQVAEHPLLGSVREALQASGCDTQTVAASGATPILVRNVERRITIATHPDAAAGRPDGLYGSLFAVAPPDVVRRAVTVLDPPTPSNIIAMAAPYGGVDSYTAGEIEQVLATALTSFVAARHESEPETNSSARTVIHTGFWGCGVFGGDRTLMTTLQVLAAGASGVDAVVFHAGDDAGAVQAQAAIAVARDVSRCCGRLCGPDVLIDEMTRRGYRWGVGDGN